MFELNEHRVREQVVSVRGGTRPTPSVYGVAAAASTFKRVDAPLALTPLHASENITGVLRPSVERPQELVLKLHQGRREQLQQPKLFAVLIVVFCLWNYRLGCFVVGSRLFPTFVFVIFCPFTPIFSYFIVGPFLLTSYLYDTYLYLVFLNYLLFGN
ncbi:hypothetical protein Lal_00003251 [Lupinus albus]|nr:hypothetical protein Lal_00003251 [Lupinus albus]